MTVRKFVFWMHLAAGVVAGTVILVMSVTGVMLAYRRQIVEWAESFRSTPPSASAARLPIETLLRSMPPVPAGAAVTVRSAADAPVAVRAGEDPPVYYDAYAGRRLGEGSAAVRHFLHQVEEWHTSLATGGEADAPGRILTGACNLAFVFMVLSGPYLWLPRKWTWPNVKAVLWFRRTKGRARDFNWHNVIGIWCFLPLLFLTLTAVVMSYRWANDLIYRMAGSAPPAPYLSGRLIAGIPMADPSYVGINDALARAERQVGGWQSITLRLPSTPDAPLAFQIDQSDGGRPDLRYQLVLDRRTGAVRRWETFSSYSPGRRMRAWVRFTHTGEAGGWLGETIAAIASAGAAVLVWTGLALALRRFRQWRAKQKRPATQSVPQTTPQ